MQASRGILTARGGMVSHAAVVARGWGIPAVVGAGRIEIEGDAVHVGRRTLHAGDEITIDGSSGNVYLGILDTAGADAPPELETLLAWADAIAAGHVQVRANADTEGDASQGRILGAQGIGLCRTEHMFLAADRLPIMRRFIMARSPEDEEAALAELEQAQTTDFETVLEAMDGLPVTVRLLDPPLHEFLPDLVELTARDARGELDESEQIQLGCVRRLREANPMIGTRGVRLGVVRTGVYEMQVRALCQAAANLFARGKRPCVEIMIPLVVEAEELRIARGWVRNVLDEIGHPELKSSVITVGAMIETPRAALTAGELAKHADFFSFGTNDLTQMTYAFSRDDVEAKLLPAYLAAGILPANPFAVLDQEGVGELVRIACRLARAAKPNIKLGACGEHAGHPDSAAFLVGLGLDSVSCSPFRVPLARLGVAQALLASGRVRIGDIEFDLEPAAPSGEAEHAGDMPDDVHDSTAARCRRGARAAHPSCARVRHARRFPREPRLVPGRDPRRARRRRPGAPHREARHVRPAATRQGAPGGADRHVRRARRAGRAQGALRPVPRAQRGVQAAVHRVAGARRRPERPHRCRLRRRVHRPADAAVRRRASDDRRASRQRCRAWRGTCRDSTNRRRRSRPATPSCSRA